MICFSSANTRSAATARSPSALAAAAVIVSRSISKPSSAASRASLSVRSGSSLNAVGPTIRSRRARRSAAPPHGSISSPSPSSRAIALIVTSRLRQILFERFAHQRRQIDLPAAIPGDDAPRTERLRQGERVRRGASGERPRHGAGVTLDDHVPIEHRPAEQLVADRAADQPAVLGDRCERS